MDHEITVLIEPLVTVRALEWSLVRMDPGVGLQLPRQREALSTDRTDMRLFPQMDLTVSVEQAFRLEALSTGIAGIRPFVTVGPHMHVQKILFVKPGTAYLAGVCFFAGMAQRVVSQQ